MPFDGVFTKAIVDELNPLLKGGKINKIYQPEKNELMLTIYNKGTNHNLFISSDSNRPTTYISTEKKENPKTPPAFCMLMRKHILGGIILNIEQFSMDRIINITISTLDEMAMPIEKTLVIEIMGRHSNIILIDKKSNKIIDSIKRISFDKSRVRQILPGLIYSTPPTMEKINPFKETQEGFINKLNTESEIKVFKFLYQNYIGFSPILGKEIALRAQVDEDMYISSLNDENKKDLFHSFSLIIDSIYNKDYLPILIYKNNSIKDFYALNLKQFKESDKSVQSSLSSLLDKYYNEKNIFTNIKEKSKNLKKIVTTYLERTKTKLEKQTVEFRESKNRDIYKTYGDLLSTNIYKVIPGDTSIEVENYFDENLEKIKIPLDKKKRPHENIDYFYKKYSKLKNAEQLLKSQIPETKNEIKYLENILFSIENAEDYTSLEEVKEELIQESYIKKKHKYNKNSKPKPYHYISSDGYDIYVGKNNKQNDYLTLTFANKNDYWFHTKTIPGSHVIVRNIDNKISKTALQEAALLASYHSKGKYSSNVEVDFTQKKNVKKPNKAKAGMVIYENYETLFVTPTRDLINKIKKIK